jgi:hypothetical protein
MRKIERIDMFLETFGKLWKKYPDMRFGQLIENVFEKFNLFYVEDDISFNHLCDILDDIELKKEFEIWDEASAFDWGAMNKMFEEWNTPEEDEAWKDLK